MRQSVGFQRLIEVALPIDPKKIALGVNIQMRA
jgi:hypothetical protein